MVGGAGAGDYQRLRELGRVEYLIGSFVRTPFGAVLVHASTGSFDFVAASLREPATTLRMTKRNGTKFPESAFAVRLASISCYIEAVESERVVERERNEDSALD